MPPADEINWKLWGNFVGARDFSPDYVRCDFGTKVPCSGNHKHQFVKLCTQTLGHAWAYASLLENKLDLGCRNSYTECAFFLVKLRKQIDS